MIGRSVARRVRGQSAFGNQLQVRGESLSAMESKALSGTRMALGRAQREDWTPETYRSRRSCVVRSLPSVLIRSLVVSKLNDSATLGRRPRLPGTTVVEVVWRFPPPWGIRRSLAPSLACGGRVVSLSCPGAWCRRRILLFRARPGVYCRCAPCSAVSARYRRPGTNPLLFPPLLAFWIRVIAGSGAARISRQPVADSSFFCFLFPNLVLFLLVVARFRTVRSPQRVDIPRLRDGVLRGTSVTVATGG